MGLSRVRLGDLIAQRREKNPGLDVPSKGVTSEGFIDPKQPDADTHLYNVFYKGDFVFNPARMEINSIAFNDLYDVAICSSLYEVFYVTREDLLEPRYLNLFVKRDEFARRCSYIGWGSAREYCRVGNISEIEIDLPPIEVQRKYVAIYEAMLANQRACERGLDDLKLTCDALYDKCKHEGAPTELSQLLTEVDNRNSCGDDLGAMGISLDHTFIESRAELKDVARYKLVEPGKLACNLIHVGRDAAYPIAKNDGQVTLMVSPDYFVFEPRGSSMGSYLMGWFSRNEVGRNGWFICDTDIRGRLNLGLFLGLRIPVPDDATVEAIAELREAYQTRSSINDRLKAQLKDICPILIRGSIEEASK